MYNVHIFIHFILSERVDGWWYFLTPQSHNLCPGPIIWPARLIREDSQPGMLHLPSLPIFPVCFHITSNHITKNTKTTLTNTTSQHNTHLLSLAIFPAFTSHCTQQHTTTTTTTLTTTTEPHDNTQKLNWQPKPKQHWQPQHHKKLHPNQITSTYEELFL